MEKVITCLLELEDYEQRIQIAAYNLLGKKVSDNL
jgi:hypothetical protein